jgi:hypothetical protein
MPALFIELPTHVSNNINQVQSINVNLITRIYPNTRNEDHTFIEFSDGYAILVTLSFAEVRDRINALNPSNS